MPATISRRLFACIFLHGNMQLLWVSVTHRQLLPFSRACFCVVLAGGMLVLHPATEHWGQRQDRNRYACILLQRLMHANSDTETSHACVSYRMMKSVLLSWTPSLNDHCYMYNQFSPDTVIYYGQFSSDIVTVYVIASFLLTLLYVTASFLLTLLYITIIFLLTLLYVIHPVFS